LSFDLVPNPSNAQTLPKKEQRRQLGHDHAALPNHTADRGPTPFATLAISIDRMLAAPQASFYLRPVRLACAAILACSSTSHISDVQLQQSQPCRGQSLATLRDARRKKRRPTTDDSPPTSGYCVDHGQVCVASLRVQRERLGALSSQTRHDAEINSRTLSSCLSRYACQHPDRSR